MLKKKCGCGFAAEITIEQGLLDPTNERSAKLRV
jgi:hypothetical protein